MQYQKSNESGGLLIMPVSINGMAMRNILGVLFSKIIRKQYQLPKVTVVSFLQTVDVENVRIDGEVVPAYVACQRLAKEIDPSMEIRMVPINDYSKEIPSVILKAVREFGKDGLILDLTSGKKDITGTLYTAACIGEIGNMIYVDVKRDEGTGEFYVVSAADEKIAEKVKLTKFKTIGEMENLASINCMDFIIYKKTVQEILPRTLEKFLSPFNRAIDDYFSRANGAYVNCIREIGLINESVIVLVANRLRSLMPEIDEKNDLRLIQQVQMNYEECADPNRRKRGDEARRHLLQERYKKLHIVFKLFPALFEMISLVTNYRNLVSHNKSFLPQRDDAKLVMDTMLRIFRCLADAKWL